MFYKEHEPAHFHAECQDEQGKFDLDGHLYRIAFNHSSEDAMNFLPSVIRAEYGGGYRIRLTFNDDLQKTIDFAQWLDGPVFEPLKDPACFSTFFLDGGAVAWPNGADVAPETLYAHQGVAEEAA